MPVGARIRTNFHRPDPRLVSRFVGLASCDVADALGRLHIADPAIRHIGGPARLSGVALPVLCRPDDNLMIHAAIDVAHPGDVIVVAGGGGTQTALVGELVTLWARKRGVAGFIIDGAVRDTQALALPTFARGASPRAPFKQAAGEVGYPVGLGGVSVAPGDIIVADEDGVVVVPQTAARNVLAKVADIAAKDQAARAQIEAGTYDRAWVQEALRALGVEEESKQ